MITQGQDFITVQCHDRACPWEGAQDVSKATAHKLARVHAEHTRHLVKVLIAYSFWKED